jgi:hypothetical protein
VKYIILTALIALFSACSDSGSSSSSFKRFGEINDLSVLVEAGEIQVQGYALSSDSIQDVSFFVWQNDSLLGDHHVTANYSVYLNTLKDSLDFNGDLNARLFLAPGDYVLRVYVTAAGEEYRSEPLNFNVDDSLVTAELDSLIISPLGQVQVLSSGIDPEAAGFFIRAELRSSLGALIADSINLNLDSIRSEDGRGEYSVQLDISELGLGDYILTVTAGNAAQRAVVSGALELGDAFSLADSLRAGASSSPIGAALDLDSFKVYQGFERSAHADEIDIGFAMRNDSVFIKSPDSYGGADWNPNQQTQIIVLKVDDVNYSVVNSGLQASYLLETQFIEAEEYHLESDDKLFLISTDEQVLMLTLGAQTANTAYLKVFQ